MKILKIQLILLAAAALWFAFRHASFLVSSEVKGELLSNT